MRKSLLIFLLPALLLSSCKGKEETNAVRHDNAPAIGKDATDFLFSDMDGAPFRMSEEKGKVTVLFFWRLKCKECTDSMASLNSLHLLYKDKGLNVVTIDEDSVHSASIYKIADFLKENNYTFRVLRDEDGDVAGAYKVIYAPRAFIVDKNGKIAAIVDGKTGWTSEDKIRLVEGLLKK
ncbi:MAG: TlpA disulfide reductase family protein [Thermodesulfobacteriota bacterium]